MYSGILITYPTPSSHKSAYLLTIAYCTVPYVQSATMSFGSWASSSSKKFNAGKCHRHSINSWITPFFKEYLTHFTWWSPFLPIWNGELTLITFCKKHSFTLGFIRRILNHCSVATRTWADVSLIWSTLEWVWWYHLRPISSVRHW